MNTLFMIILSTCGIKDNGKAQSCKLDLLNCYETIRVQQMIKQNRDTTGMDLSVSQIFVDECVKVKLMRDVKRPL